MNRKAVLGLSLETIIRVALAVLLVLAAFMIGCEIFQWGLDKEGKALEIFQERLVPKIKETITSDPGDFKSASIIMKDKSYITFFSAGSERIHMFSEQERGYIVDHYFARSSKCKDVSQACICICFNYETESIEGQTEDKNIICKDPKCEVVGDATFQRTQINNAEVQTSSLIGTIRDFNFEGGAIVQRNLLDIFGEGLGGKIEQPENRAIYLKKEAGNLISVCEGREPLCFE